MNVFIKEAVSLSDNDYAITANTSIFVLWSYASWSANERAQKRNQAFISNAITKASYESVALCPLCLLVLGSKGVHPMITTCGHVFCNACFTRTQKNLFVLGPAIATTWKGPVFINCPICRQPCVHNDHFAVTVLPCNELHDDTQIHTTCNSPYTVILELNDDVLDPDSNANPSIFTLAVALCCPARCRLM